jgi:dTMP kinase
VSDERRPGRFITIEGPEGSGKTSQAARLRAALIAAGHVVHLSREPGGTAAGERIRELLLHADPVTVPIAPRTDVLLFNAARAQHVDEAIRPALERGEVAIVARYADSTLAYQGYGSGQPLGELRALGRFATAGLVPDLTILLDVPVEVGLARKGQDERLRFEEAFDHAFHERVRAGFLELAAAEPERWVVIDATADEARVAASVAEAVRRLGLAI